MNDLINPPQLEGESLENDLKPQTGKPRKEKIVKERLDKLLMAHGYFETRSQAQGTILAGKVLSKTGQKLDKPGVLYSPDILEDIVVHAPQPFVSRGGLKLQKALAAFQINPQDKICMDVGASTGGFTDCLLQQGALKVYAVDVGHNQLDWRLRQNPQVVSLENTNIRHLAPSDLQDELDLVVVDVAFISLQKIIDPLAGFFPHEPAQLPEGESSVPQDTPPSKNSKHLILLFKPQFEYKDTLPPESPALLRDLKHFDGVVRGEAIHQYLLETGTQHLLEKLHAHHPHWTLAGLDYSPITGPKGNIEFLIHFYLPLSVEAKAEQTPTTKPLSSQCQKVVENAYRGLAQPVLD
ncbi:MAG: TlyA family RNA methyltransferase [Cyanobacteria bacterium]|nr:TlyA family RNA methyltransferase [Cyanobacteriota bacterium]